MDGARTHNDAHLIPLAQLIPLPCTDQKKTSMFLPFPIGFLGVAFANTEVAELKAILKGHPVGSSYVGCDHL